MLYLGQSNIVHKPTVFQRIRVIKSLNEGNDISHRKEAKWA